MNPTGLCLLLLAAVACAAPQSEGELHIPVENDNHFPPDNILEPEGSGEEPAEVIVPDKPDPLSLLENGKSAVTVSSELEGSKASTVGEPTDISATAESIAPTQLDNVQLPVSGDSIPEGSKIVDIEEPADVSITAKSTVVPQLEDEQSPVFKEGEQGQGTGSPIGESTADITVTTSPPQLEDVQSPVSEDILPSVSEKSEDSSCPTPCVCHIEGDTKNFVVDCSGYDLKEFPTPIDSKTTTLNIQNNKLTEIPKEVSLLKNLKVLNADNNLIMDLASGSISELHELRVLKLGNNRLIEYPKDLKNGFGLTKLEELDLGGNDMRTGINRDIFTHFKALKKLTLPTESKELFEDLCTSLKGSLATVCTGSCTTNSFECPDAPTNFEDDLLNIILPGTIALSSGLEEAADPAPSTDIKTDTDKVVETEAIKTQSNLVAVAPETGNEFQQKVRSSANKVSEGSSPVITAVDPPKEGTDDHKEADVAISATTIATKTTGVDKSIIGMIVAGMVLVVAGITIKKNWSSIKNRFSSSPRAANERPGANANGTAPEEVPLQEKSPV